MTLARQLLERIQRELLTTCMQSEIYRQGLSGDSTHLPGLKKTSGARSLRMTRVGWRLAECGVLRSLPSNRFELRIGQGYGLLFAFGYWWAAAGVLAGGAAHGAFKGGAEGAFGFVA